jgi:hypothetical protein
LEDLTVAFEFEGHVDVAGRPDAVKRVRSVTTGASGRPEFCPVKG